MSPHVALVPWGRLLRSLSPSRLTAAQAVGRTPTALGAFYRRIKSRIGGRGAITATAHKLARLVDRMLKFGTANVAQSLLDYEAQVRAELERSLRRSLPA